MKRHKKTRVAAPRRGWTQATAAEADAAANNAEWRARQEHYAEQIRRIQWQAEQERASLNRSRSS